MQARVEPATSSQTAAPEMEPPFLFGLCKGTRPVGTHVNHELVKDGSDTQFAIASLSFR